MRSDSNPSELESATGWTVAMQLNKNRQLVSGSAQLLSDAVRRGADLRVYTEFRHNEHIQPGSANNELIKEVADFRITYLLADRWTAGIINLRMPVELPDGFGPRPSMSFFLYNQDATQAIARPYLDGDRASADPGPSAFDDHRDMPLYHQADAWDSGTNAPSSNFVYDFEKYVFWVSDNWKEVYAHNEHGVPVSGSLELLERAFESGLEVKAGITGLCADLQNEGNACISHEVFIHCGSCYYYTASRHFSAASQPVVRVRPAIPLRYVSEGWDFGWLIPRTDGHLARWLVDPYTLKFRKSETRHPMRWFVR